LIVGFSDVEVVIVGVWRFVTYYINFGALGLIYCIIKVSPFVKPNNSIH